MAHSKEIYRRRMIDWPATWTTCGGWSWALEIAERAVREGQPDLYLGRLSDVAHAAERNGSFCTVRARSDSRASKGRTCPRESERRRLRRA